LTGGLPLYQQQQFDSLLHTAVERYVKRLIYRCGGSGRALGALREDAGGEGSGLAGFVDAFFRDFLLDNTAGAAFILQASADASWIAVESSGTIGGQMQHMAGVAFARLLRSRSEEALEREGLFEVEGQR
jgi:hypothetical protein